jgi:hypothetical protein
MKYLVCLFPLVIMVACNKDQAPTAPAASPWFYLDFTGYGEALQPGFLKVYSDSSWEEYGGIDTVNGTAYVSTLTSDSSLSYYTLTTGQYAGYKLTGQGPIIFDAPLPFLPMHWPSDTTFARTATFTFSGLSVSITDFYTLIDTAGIGTPVGNFSPAPHFQDVTYVALSDGSTGYASQDIWTARGPGVVVTVQQGQSAVYFIRGYVNGQSWGSASLAQKILPQGGLSHHVGLRGLFRQSGGAVPSWHALSKTSSPNISTSRSTTSRSR